MGAPWGSVLPRVTVILIFLSIKKLTFSFAFLTIATELGAKQKILF